MSRRLLGATLLFLLAVPSLWAGVDSREYKLLLRTDAFADRDEAVATFWERIVAIAKANKIDVTVEPRQPKKRWVEYLDTEDSSLRANGYIFRLREKAGAQAGSKRTLTLKFRSHDLQRSVAVKIQPLKGKEKDRKCKLEEDIVAFGESKFSHSASTKLKGVVGLSWVKDISKVFDTTPPLPDPEKSLGRVNGFRAYEVKIEGPTLTFDGQAAETSLTLWSQCSAQDPLVVAEFSYTLGGDEKCPAAGAEQGSRNEAADRFHQTLQDELKSWIDPQGITKTTFVYQHAQECQAIAN